MKPFVPLSESVRDGSADETDVALARELAELAAPTAPDDDGGAGWARISQSARAMARARRRRFLATELARLLGLRRVAGLAVALSAGVAVIWGAGSPRVLALWNSEVYLSAETLHLDGTNPAKLRLASGALLEVNGAAQVDPRHGVVRLEGGRVDLRIPRLENGETFRVITPDAEVSVHGTRFQVERTPDETRVSVEEGLVEVRSRSTDAPSVLLRAGDSVSVPSASRHLEELTSRAVEAVRGGRCEDEPAIRAFVRAAPSGADLSPFHYFDGFCAYQRGELAAALPLFAAASRESTDAVRADNAAARVAQIRSTLSPASSREAWTEYLERYPDGLHREAARGALRRSNR